MFEVLAFVYENYWNAQACPQWEHLERKLNAVGFEAQEIQEALNWLTGLSLAAQGTQINIGEGDDPSKSQTEGSRCANYVPTVAHAPTSMRIYSVAEQDHLGSECLGFVTFLEASNVLPATMREIVIDRAMAAPGDPLPLDDLKIIILMVYWSFGEEPDALVLDELCDDVHARIAH